MISRARCSLAFLGLKRGKSRSEVLPDGGLMLSASIIKPGRCVDAKFGRGRSIPILLIDVLETEASGYSINSVVEIAR